MAAEGDGEVVPAIKGVVEKLGIVSLDGVCLIPANIFWSSTFKDEI